MPTRLMYLFPALVCLVPLLSAQRARTELIGTEQGLSQGMVFDILQSRDGFLWIATKDGLNRYDGYRFEVYNHDPFDPFSIGASEIRRLHEDRRGRLWLAYEGGLDLFEPGTGRFFHLPLPDIGFDGYTGSFAESPEGAMWLTVGGRLLKIDLAPPRPSQSRTPFPEFACAQIEAPSSAVRSDGAFRWNTVFFHDNGTLFASANNGVYRLDARSRAPAAGPEVLAGRYASILGADGRGDLWLHTPNTLWTWNPKTGTLRKMPVGAQGFWRLDAMGNLLGNADGVVQLWRPEALAAGGRPDAELALTETNTGTQSYYLTAFCTDRAINLWAGTSGYGLLKTVLARPKFASHLPVQSLRALVETPDGAIVSMHDPARSFRDKRFAAGGPNPWLARFPRDKTACLARFDEAGDCWVRACDGDLYRVDARTKTPMRFDADGVGLLIERKGRRVLGLTETALLALDPRTGEATAHPLPDGLRFRYNVANYFNFLMEDEAGALWIWAFKGLLKATPAGTVYRFERFVNNPQDRATLSNDLVLCAADDPAAPDRFLWIGTKGGGLNRLDKQTGRAAHFKTDQGLPDNVVYGILPDGAGTLWLSTNKGLCRFDPRDFSVKNFSAADGLQSNEFNQGSFLKTADGHLIFGGVNGLTVFHPDSLRFNEHVPPVRIVGLRVNTERRPLPGTPPLTLGHRQNVLAIDVAALDFTMPAQNQYRYQLEQIDLFKKSDAGTVELGTQRTVSFANLRPGRYVFRVWGSNNDGIWNPNPAVLEFVIRPPWWATWWAYLAYAALLTGAFAAFYRYRRRRRLAEQEALRLRELDEFKSRFFTNITHEFRTPLTVILGMADRLTTDGGRLAEPAAKNSLNLIKRSGENLLRLINQILDLAKLEDNTLKMNYVQGDVLPYLRYIAESLHSLANAQNVLLRVEAREPEVVMDYDPERLLQIVHNLLSNAVKFTPSGGKVVLGAACASAAGGKRLLLTVADTGVGIPSEDLPHIFDRYYQARNQGAAGAVGGTGIGLALTRELVKAMGGEIFVESRAGTGTTFTVSLPVSNAAPAIQPSGPPVAQPSSPPDGRQHDRPPGLEPSPHLLLIEDNPDVVEYLASCLGEGYVLDFAYNGRAGIEKALEAIPDLIVSDVMMPEKNGFEVCETLKNDERTSHVPIVLLTAKADVEHRIAGLKRGADAYLAKPFDPEELLATLGNLLELRRKMQARYSNFEIKNREGASRTPETGQQPAAQAPMPGSTELEDVFLTKLKTAVESRLSDGNLSVDDICRMVGMSHPVVHRKVTALTGHSLTLFVRGIRLARAQELLLARPEWSISEVAYATGFNDPKFFSRVFSEAFGVSPTVFRQNE